jgi:hypothetical protein
MTGMLWSGCPDLNRGPLRPERSALTKLRHSPSWWIGNDADPDRVMLPDRGAIVPRVDVG